MIDEFDDLRRNGLASNYRRALNLAETSCQAPTIVVRSATGRPCAIARLTANDWDSQVLGASCGNVDDIFVDAGGDNLPGTCGTLAIEIAEAADRRKMDLVSCRIEASNAILARAFEEIGFRVVDELAIYLRPLEPTAPAQPQPLPEDLDDCLVAAAAGMEYGRIHQDPRIPKDLARQFYLAAMRGHIESGSFVTTLGSGGRTVGVAIGVEDSGASAAAGRRVGYLWLIALRPEARGLGLGRKLLQKFFVEFASRIDLLEIGAQVKNIPANRLYLGQDCVLACHLLALHRWRDRQ